MSAPDTAVPPTGLDRPHGLGDVLAVAWRTMRARYGLYVLITALPTLLSLVWGVLVVVVIGATVLPAITLRDPGRLAVPGLWVVLGLGYVVAYLALVLVSVRAEGMKAVLTHHTLEGRRPRLGDLWRETSGYVSRVLLLVLLGLAAALVVAAVFGAVGALSLTTELTTSPYQDPGVAPLLLGAVGWLVYAVFYVLLIWLSVRLVAVTVVVALERRGGVPALRRAWRMTLGRFWRTLGYTVVGSLPPGVVLGVVAGLSGLVVVAVLVTTLADQLSGAALNPAELVGTLVLASVLGYLPTLVAAVLVQPYYGCFATVYAKDLARRRVVEEPVTSPEGGWQPRPYPTPPTLPGPPPPGGRSPGPVPPGSVPPGPARP